MYRRLRADFLSLDLSKSEFFMQPEEELLASNSISVIIAIHDAPEVVQRCFESLERYAGNVEVILVDDGSQLQETIDLIREYQQRNGWTVIRHEKPLGHSRACKDGSQVATRPYLCFLNSDTIITPWSWKAAKEAFDSDQRIAVTGPATSRAATKQTIRRADYCRNYWTNSQIYAFAKKYVSKQLPKFWIDLPMVGGFAFFIRRTIWEEFGGFDPKLPDYGNESELCRRVLAHGLRVIWTRNSYIHHFGKVSYSRIAGENDIRQRSITAEDYINSLHRNR